MNSHGYLTSNEVTTLDIPSGNLAGQRHRFISRSALAHGLCRRILQKPDARAMQLIFRIHKAISELGAVQRGSNRILYAIATLFLFQPWSLAQGIKSRDELKANVEKSFLDPPDMKKIVQDGRVWIDKTNKRVVVDGYVVLRKGSLEMFACPVGTKEHESIIALLTKAQYVHAGLLAVGALPGKPTQFEPYRPATGSTIRISILWRDADGKKNVAKAQDWIQHVGTEKAMKYDWVFAGSGIYKDDQTGEELYLAEAGDLICVANFPSATLDLAVRSDDTNSGLEFRAFTEKIPAEGTPVRLVLEVSKDEPARGSEPLKLGPLPDVVKPVDPVKPAEPIDVPANKK